MWNPSWEKIQRGEARGLQIRATQSTTKEKKDLEKRKQLPKCWPGSSYKQGTQKSAGLQGAEIEKKNTFVLLKKSLLVSIDEEKGNSGGTPRSWVYLETRFSPQKKSWSSFKRAWTTRHKAVDEDEADAVEVQELDDPCRSLPVRDILWFHECSTQNLCFEVS